MALDAAILTVHDDALAESLVHRGLRIIPATDADVAATTAIFALHGDAVRIVSLPAWPAKAKWVTFKDYPIQIQGETDSKTGVTKYIDGFRNEGFIWQAEEVQVDGKWQRFYGFVGPHVIARVPADQIEFLKDD